MSVDLRPLCSPIRNQGQCGSCTAFGTVGAWEEILRKLTPGDDTDLSEKHLFFCSGGKCSEGNTPDAVLNQATKGVCIESCLPYGITSSGIDSKCASGICDNWWEKGKKLASWKSVKDVNEMKNILQQGHALATTMAVHQSFMNFCAGVYHSLGASDPIVGYHMISCVGFSDGLGAWLIRNSWGTGWGESGYVWIKYGDSEIDSEMYQLIPDGEIPPQPGPTPSPCSVGNGVAVIMNFFPWILGRKGRFYYMNFNKVSNYKKGGKRT